MYQPNREPRRRRVAILVDEGFYYGRAVITGIAAHAAARTHWDCYLGSHAWAALQAWQPEGVIAHLADARHLHDAVDIPVPLVNTADTMVVPYPTLMMDNAGIGRLAAEYLQAQGYRHYAFFTGRGDKLYAHDRMAGFCDALAARGIAVHRYVCELEHRQKEPASSADEADLCDLRAWVRELPRPVALFASDNAALIARLCLYAGLRVPAEIAIVSGDGDQVSALLSSPPLTTIDTPLVEVGHRAADLLERLMAGGRADHGPLRVAPTGVTARQSTGSGAVIDQEVTEALRVIRAHATRGLTVDALADVLPISRREMERRFRRQLGTTPHAEIVRVRLREAEQLLLTTDLTLAEVSLASGFPSQQYFTHVLRRERGTTPARFRALYRQQPRGGSVTG